MPFARGVIVAEQNQNNTKSNAKAIVFTLLQVNAVWMLYRLSSQKGLQVLNMLPQQALPRAFCPLLMLHLPLQ